MIAFRFRENCAVQHVPSEKGLSGTNRAGPIRFQHSARKLGTRESNPHQGAR
jgi:hypothetical protein